MANILLTGGSGDLATVVAPQLVARGDTVLRLDVRPPHATVGTYLHGSILDRPALEAAMQGVDVVVHIAAWHGIHEVRGQKDVYDFWNLNVNGTFEVFQAAAVVGVKNIIYLSSTSIREHDGLYGHTKVMGEEIARTYAARHHMNVITLRPRAFIPHWNTATYANFLEWIQWFWRGAVHIEDVAQAVLKSIDTLHQRTLPQMLTLIVDGAYDVPDDVLHQWTADTFATYYPDYVALAAQYNLDTSIKPHKLDSHATEREIGYQPRYSLRNLLEDLARYGAMGPPRPF